MTTNAANDRIFLLTHVMEVCRADGGHVTVEQAESVLEHLRITLSFAFGHWVSPVLPRGYDDHDLVVWERWSAPICDPLRKVPPGRLYTGRPDDLTELVGRAIPALSDRTCPGATRLQMRMATSAMESGFIEPPVPPDKRALAAARSAEQAAEPAAGPAPLAGRVTPG